MILAAKYSTFWLVHDTKHSYVATTVSVQNEVYNDVHRWLKLHKLYIVLIFLKAFDLEQKTAMQMCGQVASHIWTFQNVLKI